MTPLEPTIGGEVRGFDLSTPLESETVAAVRAALLERKVLVFRGQHLSPDAMERVTRYLGEPFRRDADYGGLPDYGGNPFVGTIPSLPPGRRPTTWHLGGTWQETPPRFELLHLEVVPPVGGATLFADLQAAFADLSAPMQRFVGELRAAHSTEVSPRGRTVDSVDVFDPDHYVEHPVVVTHPETGITGLYLTSRITHLVGIPPHEAAAVLAFLRSHASHPRYHYRNRWEPGDVVVWDNCAVWHCAVDDYGDAERRGYKTVVTGGGWRPA